MLNLRNCMGLNSLQFVGLVIYRQPDPAAAEFDVLLRLRLYNLASRLIGLVYLPEMKFVIAVRLFLWLVEFVRCFRCQCS